MRKIKLAALGAAIIAFHSTTALSANPELDAIRAEIAQMKSAYETRIDQLEAKIAKLESGKSKAQPTESLSPQQLANNATQSGNIRDNSFNPSIGVILSGTYRGYSESNSEIAGFAVGHEGERKEKGFGVDHTELNFSSNVDDKFYGSVTTAVAEHDGDTEVELEEAYVSTLPGFGLPQGLNAKAGRALWEFGYLNAQHQHADDFADRPLPYRVYLDNAFNDDGLQLSYVLPTDFYSEIGGGTYRGKDYPSGNAAADENTYTGFFRFGDDITDNQAYRIGASYLHASAGSRLSNEDDVEFKGDSSLYGIDARYTYAPTGNNKEEELILQGEYFARDEDGTYEEISSATGAVPFEDSTSGWYAQAVYKFAPEWRVGYRYTALTASDVPAGLAGTALDGAGHDPQVNSFMVDYTNSEFSRLRLQYNHDETGVETDNQILLQYIMSIGAHGAHPF